MSCVSVVSVSEFPGSKTMDFYATPTLTMLASVCRDGAFIFYFETISHTHEKAVALKTKFPFWFILYREEILSLLNISMLYYICSVVHKTFLFFYTRRCARLRGFKLREHTFLALVPEQTRIFHIVVTQVEEKRHPSSK